MPAPVNAFLKEPTYPEQEHRQARQEWECEAEQWRQLNKWLGNPDFFPLTIKALYVFGVIYQICQCVELLLASREHGNITSIPAYGVLASGIELLGRCITGNPSTHRPGDDLGTGLWWLAEGSHEQNVDGNHVLIVTTAKQYSIADLVALRHFAAHGQATMNRFVEFDYEIFAQMGNPDNHLIATGLERYWGRVQDNEEICNRLARASIIPFRDNPLLTTLRLFSTPKSVTQIFSVFDWRDQR